MEDDAGRVEREWPVKDLLGVPLTKEGCEDASLPLQDGRKELVICESTMTELLICQAVGYSDLRGCPVAFLAPSAPGEVAEDYPDAVTGKEVLAAEAAKAVPTSLAPRTPTY